MPAGGGGKQRLHFSDVGSGLCTSLVSYLLWKKRKGRPSGHSTWGGKKKVLRWKSPSCLKRSTAPLLWLPPSYLLTCRGEVAEISFHMDLLTLSCCENGKINTVSRWQLSFFQSELCCERLPAWILPQDQQCSKYSDLAQNSTFYTFVQQSWEVQQLWWIIKYKTSVCQCWLLCLHRGYKYRTIMTVCM